MAPEKDCCDFCGRKLTPQDFEKGRALLLLRKAWCRTCAERMVERQKDKRRSKPSSGAHRSRSTPRGKTILLSPDESGLRFGDHACTFHTSEVERRQQLARFLAEGLRNHEKVVYALDQDSPERVLGYLAKEGLPAERFLRSGQLEVHSTQDVYAPDGAFDPSQMIARIKILCDQAAKEGYSGLRGTGEMSWALRGWPGSDRLLEYELRLNAAISPGRCIALCQYETPRFSPALLHQIRAAHMKVLARDGGDSPER